MSIKNSRSPPQDGPRGRLFLMSEVPLSGSYTFASLNSKRESDHEEEKVVGALGR